MTDADLNDTSEQISDQLAFIGQQAFDVWQLKRIVAEKDAFIVELRMERDTAVHSALAIQDLRSRLRLLANTDEDLEARKLFAWCLVALADCEDQAMSKTTTQETGATDA
jgi:hypothetical protein